MGDRKIILIVSLFVILAFSCKTMPDSKQETPGGTEPRPSNHGGAVAFDPNRVSQAYYASTREEVRMFIDGLNTTIESRNYNRWRDALSPEYIDTISSQENLHRISEQPIMKRRNIVLRNLNDYFTHVVVPARSASRIQVNNIDIEFISQYKVRAFITRVNAAGEELREILYNLEKIDNSWKIIN